MNQIEIKKKIIELSKIELEKKIEFLKQAIDEAQKEAASHKGRMESRYDTFKEEARAERDNFKKQRFNVQNSLLIINEIPVEIVDVIKLGAIIETDKNNYFVSVGILDAIEIDNKKYLPISLESPIGQALLNKKSGDEVEFRNQKIKIRNVF